MVRRHIITGSALPLRVRQLPSLPILTNRLNSQKRHPNFYLDNNAQQYAWTCCTTQLSAWSLHSSPSTYEESMQWQCRLNRISPNLSGGLNQPSIPRPSHNLGLPPQPSPRRGSCPCPGLATRSPARPLGLRALALKRSSSWCLRFGGRGCGWWR